MILALMLGLRGYLGWGLLGWGLLRAWAQDPGARFSDLKRSRVPSGWKIEAADTSGDPIGRNWCPYQKSRLVTFVAACKTEKLLVHSQQPCPQGAPDCQGVKVMYRVAQKPVYQVQQKVLVSVGWRCCPGFQGPDCQDYDPTANPEPTEPSGELPETWDQLHGFELGHPVTEFNEIKVPQEQQEHLLQDLQNDAQLVEDGLPGPWEAQASNLTAETTEANQTEFEFTGRMSEHLLQAHINAFLQAHFSPTWKSFGESLHSLSQAIRNLSLDVEANHQAVKKVQDSTVTRADLQELSAKFDAKIQENNQRVGQLWQDVEDQLHAQRRSVHHALSEVQAEVSNKLKQLIKAQELPGTNGSLVVASAATAAARPQPESLQARLGQLQRNISALHMVIDQREEELQSTLKNMDSVLNRHVDEIKELYSESDETFDQISKVERQVEELLVNHTGLRELRVILMEKSLIMEENKEEMERQLLELNLTLQHLQVGHADLIKYVKDCNCQRLYSDVDVIPEGQRDTVHTLEETQVSLDEQHQLDGSSLQALQSTVDAMSSTMDEQKGESERARVERARMRTQLRALDNAVEALKAVANQTRREMRQLHSSFAALLEDALRHQAVLAALFGEEMMEEMEEVPRPLPLNYDQIRLALQDAASGLQEQAFGWDALAIRVEVLEQALEQHPQLAERLQSSHDSGRAEEAMALVNLEQEIQRLNSDVKQVGQCCEVSRAASLNSSLEDLHSMLSDTRHSLKQHQQLFHGLFRNFQELMASNISLDLGKLQAMLNKKDKKQQKGLETSRKREKKQVVMSADAHAKEMEKGVLDSQELWGAGSPVAFYASSSEAATALQMVKFNATSINVGSSYFPEHGYFRAPKRGVYLFAVSITFGPGPGMGQLVFEGHRRVPVYSTEQRGGNTATTFAMVELQKGERVWFELIQGSVAKGSQPHTAFGGFLIFKT
ncbi:Mmrn2 [Phodopus roborovskii]|uniref:Multimerin-2 n=2 Tax=Phodopus roborovskii TaxID=109678 RepID=A0AAV0A8Y6_PHORO|nr:Mmrn2 [Phodopus roborovskii]